MRQLRPTITNATATAAAAAAAAEAEVETLSAAAATRWTLRDRTMDDGAWGHDPTVDWSPAAPPQLGGLCALSEPATLVDGSGNASPGFVSGTTSRSGRPSARAVRRATSLRPSSTVAGAGAARSCVVGDRRCDRLTERRSGSRERRQGAESAVSRAPERAATTPLVSNALRQLRGLLPHVSGPRPPPPPPSPPSFAAQCRPRSLHPGPGPGRPRIVGRGR